MIADEEERMTAKTKVPVALVVRQERHTLAAVNLDINLTAQPLKTVVRNARAPAEVVARAIVHRLPVVATAAALVALNG